MKLTKQMTSFLRGMEYPAQPEDLILAATRDGFNDDDVKPFAMLPERSYHGAGDINEALGNVLTLST